MPTIFLSPAQHASTDYIIGGGSEQDWMNRLADVLTPRLTASGIQYVRRPVGMPVQNAVNTSNEGEYDLHRALHSNIAPDSLAGTLRGITVFYSPSNPESQRAATILANNLKNIYPLPDLVRITPSSTIGEVIHVNSPSVLIELGYHDNAMDATWIQSNLDAIAESLDMAVSEYLNIPVTVPDAPRPGTVQIDFGNLNIREAPNEDAPVIATAVNGTPLTILGQNGDWYQVQFGNSIGYTNSSYVTSS